MVLCQGRFVQRQSGGKANRPKAKLLNLPRSTSTSRTVHCQEHNDAEAAWLDHAGRGCSGFHQSHRRETPASFHRPVLVQQDGILILSPAPLEPDESLHVHGIPEGLTTGNDIEWLCML